MKTRMIVSLSALAFFSVGGSLANADAIETLNTVEGMNQMEFAPAPLNPKDTTCNMASARSACTNGTDTLSFKGCTIHQGKGTVLGDVEQVFTGTGADKCTYPLINGETLTKTSKGLTVTFAKGSMELDSNGGTAFDGTVIPSTGITISLINDQKTIAIGGGHLLHKDHAGVVKKDHFIMTPTALLMSGAQKDGSKILASGVVRTYDQLAKSITTTTFSKLAWTTPTCCHPTAGTISETMSGSATGTTVLTFTATCGSATKVDKDGKASNITLHACK